MSADKQNKYSIFIGQKLGDVKLDCLNLKIGKVSNMKKFMEDFQKEVECRVRDDLINKINNYIDGNLIPRCKSDEGYDIGWRTGLTTLKIMLKELD